MNNNSTQSGLTPDHIVNQVRHFRKDWDHAGVRKAVNTALNTYPLGIVRQAALQAAQDPKVRTPGVIDARCQLLVEAQRRAAVDNGAAAALPATTRHSAAGFPAEHCQNPNCECPHSRCFNGWQDDGDSPCPECRPALTAAWIAAGTRKAAAAAQDQLPAAEGNPQHRSGQFWREHVRASLDARRRRTSEGQNTPTEKGESA